MENKIHRNLVCILKAKIFVQSKEKPGHFIYFKYSCYSIFMLFFIMNIRLDFSRNKVTPKVIFLFFLLYR